MPPVLGPVSPSLARLWSCAGGRGVTVWPSVKAITVSSSPSRNSSITTRDPASPNALRSSMARTASRASAWVAATTTPFPCASPSALTTIGESRNPWIARRAVELRDPRALSDLPGKRMLPPASADNQYFHGMRDLVTEVPHAREHHGHLVLVHSLDHFLIADGAARLDDGRDARLGGGVNAVAEREEGVRGHDAPFQRSA